MANGAGSDWHDGAGDRGGLQRSLIVWPHKIIQYSNGTAEFFDLETAQRAAMLCHKLLANASLASD